jgi:DNA repair protein RecN (Recombination protein N)
LGGSLSTVGVLGAIAEKLIDISGQHAYHSLADRAVQLGILDALAGAEGQRTAVTQAHRALREASAARAALSLDDRQRAERVDFLRFQLEELEAAQLSPGEDVEVETRHRRLQRAAELIEVANAAEQALQGEDGAVAERIATVVRRLRDLARVDEALADHAQQLEQARLLVEDVATSLARHARAIDLDASALQQVELRLELIHRLRRKHGGSLERVLARAEEMRDELDRLESLEARLAEVEEQIAEARRQAEQQAAILSRLRQDAAARLSQEAGEHLQRLCMEGARMVVDLSPLPPREDDDRALVFGGRRLGSNGWDRAEILIAANPGEEPRPLARVASGGELSRILLALRQVIGRYDPPSTSIYDEVDSGIGGRAADVVGRSLARVARDRQVLCVTHLPQVAAHARAHFHVGKHRASGRTRTRVALLDREGRVEELARMLGASRVTAQARANARALLAAARS